MIYHIGTERDITDLTSQIIAHCHFLRSYLNPKEWNYETWCGFWSFRRIWGHSAANWNIGIGSAETESPATLIPPVTIPGHVQGLNTKLYMLQKCCGMRYAWPPKINLFSIAFTHSSSVLPSHFPNMYHPAPLSVHVFLFRTCIIQNVNAVKRMLQLLLPGVFHVYFCFFKIAYIYLRFGFGIVCFLAPQQLLQQNMLNLT